MKKTLIAILAIVIVVLLGYFIFTKMSGDGKSQGLFVESNALVANDQKPGDRLRIATVLLTQPGFVIIHADADGAPGTIIGQSELLPPGEHKNVEVVLTRMGRDGEILHAMLHKDNDNGDFDASTDAPFQGKLGGVITARFELNSDIDPSEAL